MEKKWYIVYTKSNAELKVCDLLTKKKVYCYCPLKENENNSSRNRKKPLFKNYVFVLASEMDLALIKRQSYIINFVYFLDKPATIKHEEIYLIKEFTRNYKNIQLEKNLINPDKKAEVTMDIADELNGTVIYMNNRKIKATLPSIGYALISKVENVENEFQPEENTYTFNVANTARGVASSVS